MSPRKSFGGTKTGSNHRAKTTAAAKDRSGSSSKGTKSSSSGHHRTEHKHSKKKRKKSSKRAAASDGTSVSKKRRTRKERRHELVVQEIVEDATLALEKEHKKWSDGTHPELPKIMRRHREKRSREDRCIICLGGGDDDENPVELFSSCCGQPYHASCYLRELMRAAKQRAKGCPASDASLRCGVCRKPLPKLGEAICCAAGGSNWKAGSDSDSSTEDDSSDESDSSSDSDSSESESRIQIDDSDMSSLESDSSSDDDSDDDSNSSSSSSSSSDSDSSDEGINISRFHIPVYRPHAPYRDRVLRARCDISLTSDDSSAV